MNALKSPNFWVAIASVSALVGIICAIIGTATGNLELAIVGVWFIAPLLVGGALLVLIVIPILILSNRRKCKGENRTIPLQPDLYFSYSQFFVYNESLQMPACAWTKAHSDQGFARREGTVAFGTLLEFGKGRVVVHLFSYRSLAEYERVIAVPFFVNSGKVIVDGPEETETGRERNLTLPPGNYRLVAAQCITGDEEETIDLFFEPLPMALERSAVLVADDALSPQTPLLETAGVPGKE